MLKLSICASKVKRAGVSCVIVGGTGVLCAHHRLIMFPKKQTEEKYDLKVRVRCGSDSSASACCTAGPSSNLGSAESAPLEEALYRADAMRTIIVVLY
jgi:hypothetical protein